MRLTVNAAGRQVPTHVNGRAAVPYQGVGRHLPGGGGGPGGRAAAGGTTAHGARP